MTTFSFDYLQLSVGYILVQYLPSFNSLFLFFLQYIGLRYYILSGDRELMRRVVKQIGSECYTCSFRHTNGKEVPSGYFFSKSYIGFLDNVGRYNEDERIHIFCSRQTYCRLVEEKSVKNTFGEDAAEITDTSGLVAEDVSANQIAVPDNGKVKAYIRKGQFKNLYYSPIKLDLSHINPIGDQCGVVDNIVKIYKRLGRATIFIHGVSCAGKSSIGLLVAKRLKGSYCHTFNPTDPGDSFMSLISELKDEEESPIVVVLEEVDGIIRGVHDLAIKSNPELPVLVYNKSTWVTFLDDMIFCKNVIVILTSNTSKKELDLLDEAYLRRGLNRIHAHISMGNALNIEDFIEEDKEKLN